MQTLTLSRRYRRSGSGAPASAWCVGGLGGKRFPDCNLAGDGNILWPSVRV